ncbi:MAG TPA: 50S ribosomal protein L4, partial [Porphyromonadaceae bacterium]|nr:50S ribosomal protein L4 [Porphyromonadaceae bacterium]
NKNVYLSARNLPGVEIITASDINTYKIMNCGNLVLTESSVAVIDDLLKA